MLKCEEAASMITSNKVVGIKERQGDFKRLSIENKISKVYLGGE